MTKKKILLWTIVTILVMSAPLLATDWPQWRGPFFNGSTDEKNLPSSWSQTEGIAWVSPLPGPSGATPIICNSKVFVSSTVKSSPDFVALCFDARDGKKLWEKHVGSDSRRFPRNNMVSPSAVTDGNNVFFLYGTGNLVGLDYKGNKLWSRNIETEYGNLALKFGYSSSPLLYYQKRLYVLNGVRYGKVVTCLEPKTGRQIWQGKIGGRGPWRASLTGAEDKLYCINETRRNRSARRRRQ